MISWIFLGCLVFIGICWGIYALKMFPRFNSLIESILHFLGGGDGSTLNDNSLTILSVGNLIGVGFGLIFSSLFGTSLLIGIGVLIFGFFTLKQNWFLLKN